MSKEIKKELVTRIVENSNDEWYISEFDTEKLRQQEINTRIEMAVRKGESKGIKTGKLDTAKNLIKMGMAINDIMKATNLDKNTINSIRQ